MKFISQSPSFFANLLHLENIYDKITLLEYTDKIKINKKKENFVVSEKLETNDVVNLVHNKKYQTVLNKNSPFYLRDVKRSCSIIDKPQSYFNDPVQLLFNDIPRCFRIQFNKKDDKQRVLDESVQFFSEIKSSITLDSIHAVIQEMFMNAVYDAPKEAKKLNEAFVPAQDSELIIAHDHDLIIISCVDYYGSLNIDKFTNRLNLIASQGAGSNINLNANAGGAGIGCFILLNHCLSLIIGVDSNKCTRFTCIFPIKMSQRQFDSITKNIQIIEKSIPQGSLP